MTARRRQQRLPRPGDPITAWERWPGGTTAHRSVMGVAGCVYGEMARAWEVLPITQAEAERLAAEERAAEDKRTAEWRAANPPAPPPAPLTAPLSPEDVERWREDIEDDPYLSSKATICDSHELLRARVQDLEIRVRELEIGAK